ncbi:MAG: hypothetical protein R3C20_05820 [Planctomycetaceae bacterium]
MPRQQPLDGVEKRPVVIFSDGTRMTGDLYASRRIVSPTKVSGHCPLCRDRRDEGGTQAVSRFIFCSERFRLVLAFDYRGWGDSESQLMAVRSAAET